MARGKNLLNDEIRHSFDNMTPLPESLRQEAIELFREYFDVPLVQNEILNNYIADMAKYSSNTDSVKIRACYNSIPSQLAKDNKKFQYKVVQKGGSSTIFGASIEWLSLAGVVFKCQKISQATEPIPVYADLSAFKLYG